MNLQAKSVKQYKQACEVLYVLDAIQRYGDGIVSKIALQKIIYLSILLAPIKGLILNFLRYQYNIRGPWNPDIQTLIDHLVGQDFAEIVSYNAKSEKVSHVNYQITEKGILTVANLDEYETENEKHWWITTISRLALKYTEESFASDWNGLDKIVDFVYQDPTFLAGKTIDSYRNAIDFSSQLNETNKLIEFAKEYLSKNEIVVNEQNERKIAELLLIAFFDYLFVRILNDRYDRREE